MAHEWSLPIDVQEFGKLHKCSKCGCVAIARDGSTAEEFAVDINNGLTCEDIIVDQVMRDTVGWNAFDHLEWRWENGN